MFGKPDRQATRPVNEEERTLGQMKKGESAFTTPWGMWVDHDRHYWLHRGFPARSKKGGAIRMKVERRNDGYHVWPIAEWEYEASSIDDFVNSTELKPLPVAKVHS